MQVGRIQVTAFQSSDGRQHSISRPIPVTPINKSNIIDVESSLSSSENVSIRSGSGRIDNAEQDTGDSRAAMGYMKVYQTSNIKACYKA